MRALRAAALVLFVACSAQAPVAEVEVVPVPGIAVVLRLVGLPGDGYTLQVTHESGYACTRSGADPDIELHLPPGPCSLLLAVGERRFERPLVVVGPGPMQLAWELDAVLRSP